MRAKVTVSAFLVIKIIKFVKLSRKLNLGLLDCAVNIRKTTAIYFTLRPSVTKPQNQDHKK